MDASYHVMRLAWLLRDLHLSSARSLRITASPRVHQPKGGRPSGNGMRIEVSSRSRASSRQVPASTPIGKT
ncbi:hypothetical protein ACFYOD_35575 [Streptomyces sp. NPDC006703]|uniref:hypothetical protein n=1 Tax=Streptomyces sp. NPDC006703 TaxID=3364759 RepID=UPI0036CB6CED